MTKHKDMLRCPRCGTTVATFDGLGDVDDLVLIEWRETLDRHRSSCADPASPPQGTDVQVGSEDGYRTIGD